MAPERAEIEAAAAAIDHLRWYVDAYGTAGISSPMLVQPDDSFKFNLNMTGDAFFALEKEQISGRAASMAALSEAMGAGVGVAVDVTSMQQYAAALATYQQDLERERFKRTLLDRAAREQFAAAMAAAQKIKDAQERAAAEAAATKQFTEALTGPAAGTPPTPPAPPAALTPPAYAAITNSAASGMPAFATQQSLYAGGTPSVSGETRAALLMAAGDVATSAMLGLLLDPAKVTKFSGKRVLFGVSMIAVNPGWKTKAGYSVDIQASLKYDWVPARPMVRDGFLARRSDVPIEQQALSELQRCVVASLHQREPARSRNEAECVQVEGKRCGPEETAFAEPIFRPYIYQEASRAEHPVVAAASPMGDGQALDLQASSRQARQAAYQMALSLSAAGAGAQANLFKEFARNLQTDIETRTNNILVSAYGSTGGVFGFKINPRLAASPRDGQQTHVLQVPTFPVLLVIGAEDNELHARVKVEGDRCFVYEPRLSLFTGSRWSRIDEPCISHGEGPRRNCIGVEMTETERTRAAAAALRTLTRLWDACNGQSLSVDEQVLCEARMEYLENQRQVLTEQLANVPQPLWIPAELLNPSQPKPSKPSITPTGTTVVQLAYDETGKIRPSEVTLVIVGKELDQIDASKIVAPAGSAISSVSAKLVEGTLQLTLTVTQPGVFAFTLPLKGGAGSLVSPTLIAKAPDAPYVIRREKKTGAKDATTETLTITPSAPADVVKSEIEKEKLPADLRIDVEAGTRTTTKGSP